jgi:flagellar basal-body rod protein FlgG
MDRGLYIAASGMLAEQVRQDALANDMANASTPGYKPDRSTQRPFAEVLLANSRTGETLGPLGAGAQITATVTDLRAGPVMQTDEPLDLAIQGEGWFCVQTPQGERFTRNGRFTADAQDRLVDGRGNLVLGADRRPVRVAADGTVRPQDVGVFAVTNPTKAGEGVFTGTAAGRGAGVARAGALEGSGIDTARTMVDMLASTRAYESGQKVLQTIDSTLELAARQVGGLPG